MRITSKYVLFNGGMLDNSYHCKVKMTIDGNGNKRTFSSAEEAFKDLKDKDDQGKVLYNILLAKFSQRKSLRDELLKTEYRGRNFVFASSDVKYKDLSIGLADDTLDAADETKWKGPNLLGKTLDKVRKTLLEQKYSSKEISHKKLEKLKGKQEKSKRKQELEDRLQKAKDKAEREGKLNLIDIRKMDDHQVVEKLLDRDETITADFFFVKCRPLLLDIISNVFGGRRVNYDEVVSELYYYLMRPNAKGEEAATLRTFEFRSSLYQWLKFVAIRFFIRNRQRLLNGNKQDVDLPDNEAFGGLDEAIGKIPDVDDGGDMDSPWAVMDAEIRRQEAADQIQTIFDKMTEGKKGRALQGAQNYINVLKMKYLKDMDDKEIAKAMNIKTDNVYMLKLRAVRALKAAVLNEEGTIL